MFLQKNLLLLCSILCMQCNTEAPTSFTASALQDKVYTIDNTPVTIATVLEKYRGKKILIDVWASWCSDCVQGLPRVKALQGEFPEVVFLFLSVDRNLQSWKKGIDRFQVKGAHYFLPKGQKKGPFVNFLGLRWIPRYLVVNEDGSIAVFNATNANDKNIVAALKK